MSFGKKYKKTSRNILQKEKYLQKELLKTDMLHELKNVTTGVYSVVNTHDEIPYTPSVYSDVPDTSGIRGGSWTQTIGGDGTVPEDGGVWANPGYQTNGDLKNANELDGQTNRPIFDTPWNTQANGEAGILFYQGVHNAHYYTVDANNNRKSYSASDDSDEAIAWRAGLAAVKTYPPGPEWKAYKYWVPFSIFNPRIDAYWPEGDNTPKYTGVVCGNPDNGTARALMTDWLYVGASNNQYMSTPAVSNTPAYTTILSRNSIDDASYYAGNPKDYLRSLLNVGSTAYDWIKDKSTSWYSKGQSISSGEVESGVADTPKNDVIDVITGTLGRGDAKNVFDYYMDKFVENPTDKPQNINNLLGSSTKKVIEKWWKNSKNDWEKDGILDRDSVRTQLYDVSANNPNLNNILGDMDTSGTDPKNGVHDNGDGTITIRKTYDFDGEDDLGGGDVFSNLGTKGYAKLKGIMPYVQNQIVDGEEVEGVSPTMNIAITIDKETGKVVDRSESQEKKVKPDSKESEWDSKESAPDHPASLSGNAELKQMTKDFVKDIINAGPAEIQRSLRDIKTQKNVPNKQFIIKSWEKALQDKSQPKVDTDPDPWAVQGDDTKIAAYYGGETQRDLDKIYKQQGWTPGQALPKNWGGNPKPGSGMRDTWHPGKDKVKNNKKKKTVVTASFDWMQHENMMSEEYLLRVTRKDLARNHKLTDKEISEWMETIRAINIWLKIHPQKLNYARVRYPADDPRLAELNFKMDQMQEASKEYIDMQFPVNQSIVRRIKQITKKNIDDTDPKKFKSVKQPPKYLQLDIDFNKILKLKETVTRYFKKPVKIKSWYKKGSG